MKPLLCIDVGNTHTHWALVRADDLKIVRTGQCPSARTKQTRLPLRQAGSVVFCTVVPHYAPIVRARAAQAGLPCLQLDQHSFPLPICYETPHTLGHDRLALALGALALGHARAIVVDVGTAVTVDAVDKHDGFLGGFIVPGLGIMLESLHAHTAQLPKLVPQAISENTPTLPRNTRAAMGLGCALAFAGGLEAIIVQAKAHFKGKRHAVILCGQTVPLWAKNKSHLYRQHLSLLGLACFARRQRPFSCPQDS